MIRIPTVSILICTHNGRRTIERALQSAVSQIGISVNFELTVTVIDNNSTDNTYEICHNFISESCRNPLTANIRYKLIQEEKLGLSNARTRAVLGADTEFMIFCDDDNDLSSNYVSHALAIFKNNPSIGLIGGTGILELSDNLMPPDWFKSFGHYYAVGKQLDSTGFADSKKFLWGAGLAARVQPFKSALQQGARLLATGRSGNGVISGDDSEICMWYSMMGYRLWYDQNIYFNHLINPSRLTDSVRDQLENSFLRGWRILRIYHYYCLGYRYRLSSWCILNVIAIGAYFKCLISNRNDWLESCNVEFKTTFRYGSSVAANVKILQEIKTNSKNT